MGSNGTPDMPGLDEIDRAILLILHDNPATKQVVIAEKLGLSKQTVCKRLSRTNLKNAVIDLHGSLEDILAQAKRMAARRMKRHVLSTNEKISLRACTELLKAETGGGDRSPNQVRFITVVNEVGVLESRSVPVIEAESKEPSESE